MRTADMAVLTNSPGIVAVPARVADAFEITLPAFGDERGFFKETYVRSKYRAIGIDDDFVQDSMSFSAKGVLRGLHADPQMSKLVQVLRGEAFDVIVDARRDSPTFGHWQAFRLSEGDHKQIYIPAGCLHGFLALTDGLVFCYKQGAEYSPGREIGVRWDDPDIGIEWPVDNPPTISAKDAANGSFASMMAQISTRTMLT